MPGTSLTENLYETDALPNSFDYGVQSIHVLAEGCWSVGYYSALDTSLDINGLVNTVEYVRSLNT